MNRLSKISLVLFFSLVSLILLSNKQPLTDVHWDAPIYMYQASRFADTAYLQNYVAHAAEIVREIPTAKPFSYEFWNFSRLGNIVLLGSIVTVFGATREAIQISTGLYAILMVLAVVMSMLAAMTTIELLGASLRRSAVGYAAAFSASLCIASDIFNYLAGNLVSEVPSLFLLSTSVWLLLKALQKRSLALAATSGICSFLLYVARMESLWNYVAFVVCLVPILFWRARKHFWWQGFSMAALSALVLYALYAWAFYPLANPSAFLNFAMAQKHLPEPHNSTLLLLVIAGGALWGGSLLSLRPSCASSATYFAWSWLFLTFLPWLPAMVMGLPTQTRMLAFVLPPLLLTSTLGWTYVLEKWEQHRVATTAFVLLAVSMAIVSNPFTYPLLQSLPIVWRIQEARPFLAAPEKNTYPVNALRDISRAIYATTTPTIVLWDPRQIKEEDLWVVQYFAPYDPEKIGTTMRKNLTSRVGCDDNVPLPVIEPVVLCTRINADMILGVEAGSIRILSLQAKLSRYGVSDLHLEEAPIRLTQPAT